MKKKNNIAYILSMLLVLLHSHAQNTPTIEWQNTIGGNDTDYLTSISQTPDGGYFLGGRSRSNSSGDKTEDFIGDIANTDYWIVKLDASGIIEWENTIGGTGTELLESVEVTSDGGYILGGYSYSNISGDKTENSFGIVPTADYWVVKLNSLGSIEWQNTIGGDNEDKLVSITQTTDEGYILGGYSSSDISGDKTEEYPNWGYDYWIVKLNANGLIEWQRTIGGDNHETLAVIAQTADEGYIIGGSSSSGISGDKTAGTFGGDDYWILKLDLAGTIEWQHTIGGARVDILQSISQTDDGGYIVGGYSLSDISGVKTENSNGSFDYWVLKLDATGTIEWQNTIGGSNEDKLSSIFQTTEGGYILSGYSRSFISGDKTENPLNSNFSNWVLKLNTTGTIQWQKTILANGDDIPLSTFQTLDGNYIIGGYSDSNISGDKTENSNGGNDYWIIKLNEATLNIPENDFKNYLVVYPNPTQHTMTIDFGKTFEEINLMLYTLNGQMILSKKFYQTKRITLEVNISTGLYLLNLQIEGNTSYFQKIVVN